MKGETLDQIPPLLPVDFFGIAADLFRSDLHGTLKKQHEMAYPRALLCVRPFASIRMGWHPQGLRAQVLVKKLFERVYFPQFRKGDSIELLFDTRDVKTAGFSHRFCHHFVFLPEKIEDAYAAEVTTFRSEDRHPLCDREQLQVKVEFKLRSYELNIFIPSECLHGYDPNTFERLGFTYRINRKGGAPQNFAIASDYLTIEHHPMLWASLKMRK